MFVDSHCHLNYKGLVENQADILARARDNGVSAMLNISTREREWDDVIGLAEQEKDVWASVGIHPHEADQHVGMDRAKLVAKSAHPRVIAIGETGLDYYYDKSDRAQQCTGFREHIKASRETGLPIIIHTRDAEADTATILTEEMQEGAFTGVIHCFTASAEFARIALDIVTFKNAQDLQDVAKWLPADRLLVETDAPFLAPIPHRGKTGEPAFVADTARFVALLRDVPPETLARQTSDNFYDLFTKASR
jgi:TatD DNase family protein